MSDRSRSRSRSPPKRARSRSRSRSRGRRSPDSRDRGRGRSPDSRDRGRSRSRSRGRDRDLPRDECKIFVGNLSFNTKEDDLRYDFKRYGEISDVYIPRAREDDRPRGFGFVTFTDQRDAEDAVRDMDGRDIDGRRVTVNIAKARAPIGGGGGGRGGYGDRGGGDGYSGSGTRNADGKADSEIDDMVEQRDRARRDRDYGTADRIRDDLRAKGVELDDRGRGGTTWYFR